MNSRFTEQTNEYLIGIRLNNYKEWFHAHKDMYRTFVHEPIAELGNEVYERMHAMDKNFTQIPKISRANRDIRFSKNKNPYKESKWFFLREDGKPDLAYHKPTYFFEIQPDFWRYGFFYFPKPAYMAMYRKKLEAESARFARIIKKVEKNKLFVEESESYKRPFKNDLPEELQKYYRLKGIGFTHYDDYANMDFYGDKLPDIVFKGFKELYELYSFLFEINE